MKHVFLLAFMATAFAGCASIAVTDDALVSRTSSALGIAPGDFTISDRTDSGVRKDYTVSTMPAKGHKKTYSCYVTGTVSYTGRTVSDAICTPAVVASAAVGQSKASSVGSSAGTSCNALLKAAGKC
jgi:hypothetical protein